MSNVRKTFEEFKEHRLDTVSESFCAAKWYNATVWLHRGMTSSCHHPSPHRIIDEREGETMDMLEHDPSILHNTFVKKMARDDMLNGVKTPECRYCWEIEDMGELSDRINKSIIYSDDELNAITEVHGAHSDVDLITLELAFDSICNFACMYCEHGFSTTWEKDLRKHGDIELLDHNAYKLSKWTNEYPDSSKNPYIKAFWKWWESGLSDSLRELRITGGETLMSPEFWKLLEWSKVNDTGNLRLAVNSNMGVKRNLVEKFAKATHNFDEFHMYTSVDTGGSHAEYIRDGLVWEEWKSNCEYVLEHGKLDVMMVMMTVNALSLFRVDEMMEYCKSLNERFPNTWIGFSPNFVSGRDMFSIKLLPADIRHERAEYLENWVTQNASRLVKSEIVGINRIVASLRDDDKMADFKRARNESDLKTFINEYDRRRDKVFSETFADVPELVEWVEGIDVIESIPIEVKYS